MFSQLLNESEALTAIRDKKKSLHFYNVVYKFDEEDNPDAAEIRRFFLKTAKETFWDIFGIELDYEIKFAQEYVRELLQLSDKKNETKAYASDATVLQQLEQLEKKLTI